MSQKQPRFVLIPDDPLWPQNKPLPGPNGRPILFSAAQTEQGRRHAALLGQAAPNYVPYARAARAPRSPRAPRAGPARWYYPVGQDGTYYLSPSNRFVRFRSTDSRAAKKDYSEAAFTVSAPKKPKQARAKTQAVWVVDPAGNYVTRTAHPNSKLVRIATDDRQGQNYYRSLGYRVTAAPPAAPAVPAPAAPASAMVVASAPAGHSMLGSERRALSVDRIQYPITVTAYTQSAGQQPTPLKSHRVVDNRHELQQYFDYVQGVVASRYADAVAILAIKPDKGHKHQRLTGLGHCMLENCLLFAVRLMAPEVVRRIYAARPNKWLAEATAQLTDTPTGQILAGELGNNFLASPLVLDSNKLDRICKTAAFTVRVFTPLAARIGNLRGEEHAWEIFGNRRGKQLAVTAKSGHCVPVNFLDFACVSYDVQLTRHTDYTSALVIPREASFVYYDTVHTPEEHACDHATESVGALAYVVPVADGFVLYKRFNPIAATTDPRAISPAVHYEKLLAERLKDLPKNKVKSHRHSLLCPTCSCRAKPLADCDVCEQIRYGLTQEATNKLHKEYAMALTPQSLFNTLVKKQFDLRPTPAAYADYIREAEIFISRAIVGTGCGLPGYACAELDKNRCYPSYTYSPYYRGFPTSQMYAAPFSDDALDVTAFVVLRSWDFSAMSESNQFVVRHLYARASFRCLPVVIFLRLRALGARFDVEFSICAPFRKMDLLAYASEHFSTQAHKQLTNTFIGHTIRGGISGDKPFIVRDCDLETTEQMLVEASEKYNLPVPTIVPDYDHMRHSSGCRAYILLDLQILSNAHYVEDLAPAVPSKRIVSIGDTPVLAALPAHKYDLDKLPEGVYGQHCYFADDFDLARDARFKVTFDLSSRERSSASYHWHSYVLAYASLAVLDKWLALDPRHVVVGYNTDALYISTSSLDGLRADLGDTLNADPSGWKLLDISDFSSKGTFPRVELLPEQGAHYSVCPEAIAMLGPVLTAERTVLTAPGGIGKSYSLLLHPSNKLIMCTPTKKLRDEHRQTLARIPGGSAVIVTTLHKYIQPTMSDDEYYNGHSNQPNRDRFAGRTVLVVDELTMFDSFMWQTVMRRHQGFIVALGDFMQVQNSIASAPIDMSFFGQHGFVERQMTRQADQPARHAYDYGCLLDTLRLPELPAIAAAAKNIFPQITPSEFMLIVQRAADSANPLNLTVVTASHARASVFNEFARNYHERIRCVAKATAASQRTKRGQTEPPEEIDLSVDDPRIWWGRTGMAQTCPSDYEYEPRFARTAYSLQGSGSGELKYVVDVSSLQSLHGGIYTAVTRAFTREQVCLLDCTTDELKQALTGVTYSPAETTTAATQPAQPARPAQPAQQAVIYDLLPGNPQAYPYYLSRGDGLAVEDQPNGFHETNLILRRDDRRFFVFDNPAHFLWTLARIPAEQRNFHEIIWQPTVKLFFDIDATADEMAAVGRAFDYTPAEAFDTLLVVLRSVLLDCCQRAYGHNPAILVCTSCDQSGAPATKYSAHVVVINFAVHGLEAAGAFARLVHGELPAVYRDFLDLAVYSRGHSLRTLGSTKQGQTRWKEIDPAHSDFARPEDAFIGYTVGLPVLSGSGQKRNAGRAVVATTQDSVSCPVPESVHAIMAAYPEHFIGHAPRAARGNKVYFRRTAASYCSFCGRQHDNDNTLLLIITAEQRHRLLCMKVRGKSILLD